MIGGVRKALIVTILVSLAAGDSYARLDVDEAIEIVNDGKTYQKIRAMKELEFSGIDDKRLFDVINSQVLERFRGVGRDKGKTEEVAWLIKGLATSGHLEYAGTFEKITRESDSDRLQKWATRSAETLHDYSRWNVIINSTEYAEPGRSWEDTSHLAMLTSGDEVMVQRGASAVADVDSEDPAVYRVIEERLLDHLAQQREGDDAVLAMSWMCKALGNSNNPQYIDSLKRVAKASKSRKVRGYAKMAYRGLDSQQ